MAGTKRSGDIRINIPEELQREYEQVKAQADRATYRGLRDTYWHTTLVRLEKALALYQKPGAKEKE